jgi:hypothetical protein
MLPLASRVRHQRSWSCASQAFPFRARTSKSRVRDSDNVARASEGLFAGRLVVLESSLERSGRLR